MYLSYIFLFFQVKSFGAWIGADEQFNSVLFGGLLGSLFSFLQFVASPLVGGLSDHFGRRPLLLLSTAGVALSYALWANASTFGLFVLARIIGGLSKGMDFFIAWTWRLFFQLFGHFYLAHWSIYWLITFNNSLLQVYLHIIR